MRGSRRFRFHVVRSAIRPELAPEEAAGLGFLHVAIVAKDDCDSQPRLRESLLR